MTAFTDLPLLIDEAIANYLAAAWAEELTEAQAIEDLLTVVARRARDLFGKRKTAALVERVMAEDPRPEALPVDTGSFVTPIGTALGPR